jgi:hypothetical protein
VYQWKSLSRLQGLLFPGHLVLGIGLQAIIFIDLMAIVQVKQGPGGDCYYELVV